MIPAAAPQAPKAPPPPPGFTVVPSGLAGARAAAAPAAPPPGFIAAPMAPAAGPQVLAMPAGGAAPASFDVNRANALLGSRRIGTPPAPDALVQAVRAAAQGRQPAAFDVSKANELFGGIAPAPGDTLAARVRRLSQTMLPPAQAGPGESTAEKVALAIPRAALNVAAGAGEGLIHDAADVASGIQAVNEAAGRVPRLGVPLSALAPAPQGLGQRAGYGGEQLAEYFAPYGLEKTASERAGELAAELGGRIAGEAAVRRAQAVGRLLGSAGASAGSGAAVGALHGDDPAPQAAAGALSALALPVLGRAVDALRGPIVGDLGRAAPGALAAPADMIRYAQAKGIPAMADALTNSGPLRMLSKAGENSIPGSARIENARASAAAALRRSFGEMLDSMGPERSADEAGALTNQTLRQGVGAEKNRIADQFAAIDSLGQGVGVTPTATKQASDALLAKSKLGLQRLMPRGALSTIRDIAAATASGQPIPWEQAQVWRSQLLDAGNFPDPVRGSGEAMLRQMAGALDSDMESSARQLSPELLTQWRAANAAHKAMAEDFENPLSALYQAARPGRAAAGGNAAGINASLSRPGGGGSARQLGRLEYYLNLGDPTGEAMNAFRRDFVQRLAGDGAEPSSAAKFAGALGGYSDPYLAQLLGAEQRDLLKSHAALAESVARNINPSGTAKAMAAASDLSALTAAALGHPYALAGPASTYGASILATSPRLARWVAKAPRAFTGGPAIIAGDAAAGLTGRPSGGKIEP